MFKHSTASIVFAILTATCASLVRADGMDYDLSGLDSVADVQSIPVPENPDAAYFLKIHNAYRSLVSRGKVPGLPIPHYMPDVEWDQELADIAQENVKDCYDYDYGRSWGEVRGWTSDKNHEPLHDKFDQVEKFLKEPKPRWLDYGGFAQMIAANSRRMGCARTHCAEDDAYFTICNYWSKYEIEYVMPYTSNVSTPHTTDFCFICRDRYFEDVENDTRMTTYTREWKVQRPGTPMPPKVMDSSYFLDLHNDYRDWLAQGKSPVDQKAVYMARMEWDPVLEYAARRYAEGCNINDMFPLENTGLIIQGLNGPNSQPIHQWFDPYLRKFDWFNKLNQNSFANIEFVWSISRNLGCWQTRCTPFAGPRDDYRGQPKYMKDVTILVCKYHPTGDAHHYHPYLQEFNFR